MITRRELGAGLAAIAAAPRRAGVVHPRAQRLRRNDLMHVGGDYHSVVGSGITSKENLDYNLRHGVRHLTAAVDKRPQGGWDIDQLKRMKDDCDQRSVIFEAIRMDSDFIKLRKGKQRDREIDTIAENIRKAAQIGVKIITYNWEVVSYRRNGAAPGRGGSSYECFRLEGDWRKLPSSDAGRVTHDDYWERISYFLTRIIPVAAENGVKMALHPYDPPGLPFGYQGVDEWDSPSLFDAIKRYESIVDSPFNGFQMDVGSAASGLKKPAAEVPLIVEYLGRRHKLHQVHLRNVHGGLNDFCLVFPDEGVLDLVKIVRILRDTRFSGSICPDHMPAHPDDPGRLQAYAFGYGYIKALIQAANSEVPHG